MKKILSLALAVVMLLSMGLLAGCGEETPDAGDDRVVTVKDNTIEIGMVTPLTGAASVYGNAVKKGIDLAIKEINASSTVLNGYTINLNTKDSQSDPTVGVPAFTALVDSGAAAVFGPVITSVTAACTTLANENGIVMITPSATGDNVTTESDYVFRSCFKDSYQGRMVAQYAKKKGYTEVGVLFAQGDSYSSGLRDAFVDECAKQGITVKVEMTSPTISNETSFSSQLTTIINSIGNDGFLFVPYYYDAVGPMIIPEARKQGFAGVIMGVDGMDGMVPDYVSGDLSAYNNVFFTNHYSSESTEDVVVNFIAAYKAEYNEAPNAFAALAYDAAYMMAKALEEVLKETPDSISGEKLKAAMDGMSFSGVTGNFQLDETGTPSKSVAIIEYYYDEANNAVAARYVETLG